ncbi:MAG: hypothetical protein GY926_22185 [bacterium]|nr:hypothetical protein [bacterium]
MQLYHDPQAKTLVVKMAETHYDDAIDALIAHDGYTQGEADALTRRVLSEYGRAVLSGRGVTDIQEVVIATTIDLHGGEPMVHEPSGDEPSTGDQI